MPWGGARGQNLEHLRFFLSFTFFLVWNYSYLNNRYYLDLTLSSGMRVHAHRRGKRSKSRLQLHANANTSGT